MSETLTAVTDSDKEPKPAKEFTFKAFLDDLGTIQEPEGKLKACLEFMQEALAKEKAPDFKGFWEVRKQCLPIFKETLAHSVRTTFWDTYIELTKEGRRLKTLLDEEASFAVQQIDLAITDLEKQLEAIQAGVFDSQHVQEVELPPKLKALDKYAEKLKQLQTVLSQYNFVSTRIGSLRKELIKTEMRVRQKNTFFQRLSVIGDVVFPKRKELIKEVSALFSNCIDHFVKQHFSNGEMDEEKLKRSLFFLRDEIKSLQSLAKVFTLNTQAFTGTREKLSQCWDQLRGKEKELKKEFSEQKQASQEIVNQMREKFAQFKENEEIEAQEAMQQLDGLAQEIKELKITRKDAHLLKDELSLLRAPFEEVLQKEENERKEQLQAIEKQRREKVSAFLDGVRQDLEKCCDQDVSALSAHIERLVGAFKELTTIKTEKSSFEQLIKALKEKLSEKRHQALLSLSGADQEALSTLNGFLEEKKEIRRAVKAQVEELRKTLGGSNLDFEKAMELNSQLAQEKEVLDKCDQSIRELEQKIHELKTKAENL